MAIRDLLQVLSQTLSGDIHEQLVLGLILLPVLYIVANEVVRYQARIPTLKGPSGLPLIGNLHQIRTNAAERYRQWARQFGAVYQIQLGNIPIIVVNSAAAAKILFGQHSQALSSRPEFYTFHKVRSSNQTLDSSLTFLRSYQPQLAPPSALHRTATLLNGDERELHRL